MNYLSLLIYQLGVSAYFIMAQVASIMGNSRARLFIKGRRNIIDLYKNIPIKNKKRAWFHFSSLGEYEQGVPLMQRFIALDYELIITFFSPSGYELRKKNNFTPYTFYLPIDTPKNAEIVVKSIDPDVVIFTKYEFWYFYIQQIAKLKIPLYLICAVFRKDQLFFKWYGTLHRSMLGCFQQIFVQDSNSLKLLTGIGFYNVALSGDTRFDRVLENKNNKYALPIIEKFISDKKVLLAGSSWPQEETIIAQYIANEKPSFKVIICPHDIRPTHIHQIESLFSGVSPCATLSELEKEFKEVDVLIIDRIGMLSNLYQYGTINIVGGAFGKGLHNILEALVFEKGVLFGPKYQRFPEAVNALQAGIAKSFSNVNELKNGINYLQNNSLLSEQSQTFIDQNKNASDRIMEVVINKLN